MSGKVRSKVKNHLVYVACYLLTTLIGLPERKCLRLFTAISINRRLASTVAQAMWGVITQFLAPNNGFDLLGGSIERTSRPAPAIRPSFNAVASSSSTMIGPLKVFNRKAVRFMDAIDFALIRPFVSG